MTDFHETFRSAVPPWECDIVEHFTVAYYYEKFRAAGDRALLGLGVLAKEARTTACYTRYKKELRAGDSYRIVSAPIRATGDGVSGGGLTIGHKLIDMEADAVAATTEQTFALDSPISLDGYAEWDGDPREARPAVGADAEWVPAATDVVFPKDVDAYGRLTLDAMVHRFTAAGGQLLNAIGWTPSHMRDNRVGYSTFEFQMTLGALPWVGVPLDTESTIGGIGRSSMRMVHRMIRADTGDLVAELSQFGVHLDMNARRPSSIPTEIAEAARALAGE
ncbi:thioesterase family protein [Thalassobaculum sp. OXR-137]|uniref:thioesterase family protein n=1 Tax=Thalassobaculum sp. OXR-137 TaxID=3100173 RepID=UPI002AC8D68E|nr:thioesterase family protein [Thalassobaculum sp. OXR-137]WPZ36644.1 thioesterase family protein [Thalassobaculum sp. OXR-137]